MLRTLLSVDSCSKAPLLIKENSTGEMALLGLCFQFSLSMRQNRLSLFSMSQALVGLSAIKGLSCLCSLFVTLGLVCWWEKGEQIPSDRL